MLSLIEALNASASDEGHDLPETPSPGSRKKQLKRLSSIIRMPSFLASSSRSRSTSSGTLSSDASFPLDPPRPAFSSSPSMASLPSMHSDSTTSWRASPFPRHSFSSSTSSVHSQHPGTPTSFDPVLPEISLRKGSNDSGSSAGAVVGSASPTDHKTTAPPCLVDLQAAFEHLALEFELPSRAGRTTFFAPEPPAILSPTPSSLERFARPAVFAPPPEESWLPDGRADIDADYNSDSPRASFDCD